MTDVLQSDMHVLAAVQSLLAAVGVGAQRTLPTAAAINWVLKDGLGRLGRLSVATGFGQSFDADLKVRLTSLRDHSPVQRLYHAALTMSQQLTLLWQACGCSTAWHPHHHCGVT